jgi:hypothetical protein
MKKGNFVTLALDLSAYLGECCLSLGVHRASKSNRGKRRCIESNRGTVLYGLKSDRGVEGRV